METCFLSDLDEDLDLPELTTEELESFYEWFFQRSLKQLFDAHSSVELRWDIKHWVFTNPFVTREYGGHKLWSALQMLVDIVAKEVEIDTLSSTGCHSVRLPMLGYEDVAFRVTDECTVAPYYFSFEDVCLQLHVDPDEMRTNIQTKMHREGIEGLIESNEMAVRRKSYSPVEQDDFLGIDYTDPCLFICPQSVPSLVKFPSAVTSSTHHQQQEKLFN